MNASVAAVVLGGSQEAADAARRRPPASPLAQVEAVGRALPRIPALPVDLLAQHVLQDAAEQAAAAAGPEAKAPDCLEACCLRDDLHLFMPAGPARTLLTWARLPLPLLYEGGQFSYPLRQVGLPAPLLQLALNGRASAGWDSCLWHTNLPMLAARSECALTLLQLAPGAPGPSAGQEQRRQARAHSPESDGGSGSDGDREEAEQESSEEWEDDGGGFDLRQLCVVGTRRPTAHTCWQRHLAQQPLLLLDDGSLLEAQLQQDVQVVELWKAPEGAVPSRLRGVLQVASGAQPRTALLALRDRLSRLDLRTSGGRLAQLWQCPQAQHLTAICAPPAAGDAPGSSAAEHLLAAATSSSAAGGVAQVRLFDLRRPGQPVATWDQPRLGDKGFESGTLLRWLPTALSAAGVAGSGASQQQRQLEARQARRGGVLVAGSSAGGQVVGCQFVEQAAGPALQARNGQIQEKPATAAAALLERLQASLEQQQQEQQAQQAQQAQQLGDSDAEAPGQTAGAAGVPAPLQPPPALPMALQLLWQPAHCCGFAPAPPGTPVLLQPPAEQQVALQRSIEAGRLRLRQLQAAPGAAIQSTGFESASERQQQPCHLAGLACVAADWATGQELPLPLLCSLTPRGDTVLSLLRDSPGEGAVQQGTAPAAVLPMLLPLGQGQPEDVDGSEEEGRPGGVAAADGTRLLPYIRGVPREVVAAVADGALKACGCCRACRMKDLYFCLTRWTLRQTGLLDRAGEQRQHNQSLVPLPTGDSGRSIVQLPLHVGLVQRLTTESVHAPGQPPSQQQQHSAPALDGLLMRLRRGCISLYELRAALQLLPPGDADEAESSSSSSDSGSSSSSDGGSSSSGGGGGGGGSGASEDEGPPTAGSAMRRAQREARRQVRSDWRQRRRQERHTLRDAQQAALAALLEGPLAVGSAADASKLSLAMRRGRQGRSSKSKRTTAAEGQQFSPAAAGLEGLLQRAGLLPAQPPSGLAGEQDWLQYQRQRQQQQQQTNGQPSGQQPAAPLMAPSVASLREQLAGALHRPSALEGAAAAAAAAVLPGSLGQPQGEAAGRPEWQLGARSFVLARLPNAPDGQQQQQQPAAPQLQVQRAEAAADVLSLVRIMQHEAGASTSAAAAAERGGGGGAPAPWMGLRGPGPQLTEDGAAALAELGAAWS